MSTATATEQLARMGEWVVTKDVGETLACIGLGSCIGLTLIDRRAQVAGLAHVMLPEPGATQSVTQPGKFATHAVPALFDALIGLGAARHRLDAVLVGGAQMFAMGSGSGRDIGVRNDEAVRAALKALRIPIAASATGGSKGRSVKVVVETGSVTVREAAGSPVELL